MRPLLYDFKRAVRSKALLATVIFMLLYSVAVIPVVANISGGPAVEVNYMGGYYYDQGDYEVLLYAYNGYGHPVSGASLSFTFSGGGASFARTVSSNSSGLAQFTIPSSVGAANASTTYDVNITVTGASYWTRQSSQMNFIPSPDGRFSSLYGEGTTQLTPVVDDSDVYRNRLLFLDAGNYLSPPNHSLYYEFTNSSSVAADQLHESSMRLLTNVNNFTTIFSFPSPSGSPSPAYVAFGLFDASGGLVSSITYPLIASVHPGVLTPTSAASTAITQLVAFFIPLMAILGAYSSYGGDKITGILDSVLVRPVTRGGLLLSRYLATTAGVSLAAILTMLAMDVMIRYYTGFFLDAPFLLVYACVFFVVSAAFVGLMFAVTHAVKSVTGLIGIGIGLYLIMGVFWSAMVPIILSATGGVPSSVFGVRLQIASYFLNPSQLPHLVELYSNVGSGAAFVGNYPADSSAFMLTPATLIFDGVAWVAFPLFVALRLAKRRD